MAARKSAAKHSVKKAGAKKAAKKSAKKTAKKTARKSARQASLQSFAKGDHVAWGTPQGETHGVVERKLTRPITIKSHKVAASPENPEYLVRSDKSGEQAAHKPSSLRKRKSD